LKLFGAAFESWRGGGANELSPGREREREKERVREKERAEERGRQREAESDRIKSIWREALVKDRIKQTP